MTESIEVSVELLRRWAKQAAGTIGGEIAALIPAKFTYDDGVAFSLSVVKDPGTTNWGFKSSSANGHGSYSYIPRAEALSLARLILKTEGQRE